MICLYALSAEWGRKRNARLSDIINLLSTPPHCQQLADHEPMYFSGLPTTSPSSLGTLHCTVLQGYDRIKNQCPAFWLKLYFLYSKWNITLEKVHYWWFYSSKSWFFKDCFFQIYAIKRVLYHKTPIYHYIAKMP